MNTSKNKEIICKPNCMCVNCTHLMNKYTNEQKETGYTENPTISTSDIFIFLFKLVFCCCRR